MSTSFNTPRGASSSNVIAFPGLATEAPSAGKRKKRAPYKDREPIVYDHVDGLPIIDPAGEDDEIFRHIHEHRAAIDHYDRCVTVENEAQGKVSASEHAFLQHNMRNAYEELMLHARRLILCRPTTRRGLIHQARYLDAQFSEHVGWDEGAKQLMYLPEEINDRPVFAAFLRSLAAGLRKMASEFESQSEERKL
jgi:hypothetical protein